MPLRTAPQTRLTTAIQPLRRHRRRWLQSLLQAALISGCLGAGQASTAQQTELPTPPSALANTGSTAAGSKAASGPLRIAKLLWKANPKSAAKTLSTALMVATERDELPQLAVALRAMRSEIDAVVAGGDISDPRFAAALTAHMLASDAAPPVPQLMAALDALPELEQRQLLWQVWLRFDSASALNYLTKALKVGNDSVDSNSVDTGKLDDVWQASLLTTALRNQRGVAAEIVLDRWPQLQPAARLAAIEPLTSNADTMRLLLQRVASGHVSKDLINTNQLRKWLGSREPELIESIESIWGTVRAADNAARAELVAAVLARIQQGGEGSAQRGAAVFDRVCSQCHVLHGRGYEVGPNIENNGRGSLQQLASNILDPSLVIGEAYQAQTVLTTDGEVVSGLVAADNERFLKLKVQGGKIVEFDKQEIEEIKASTQSLMPEGVETQMQPQELLDLLAYLCVLKPLEAPDNSLIPGTPENFVKP